jgi:hypothetical protein
MQFAGKQNGKYNSLQFQKKVYLVYSSTTVHMLLHLPLPALGLPFPVLALHILQWMEWSGLAISHQFNTRISGKN